MLNGSPTDHSHCHPLEPWLKQKILRSHEKITLWPNNYSVNIGVSRSLIYLSSESISIVVSRVSDHFLLCHSHVNWMCYSCPPLVSFLSYWPIFIFGPCCQHASKSLTSVWCPYPWPGLAALFVCLICSLCIIDLALSCFGKECYHIPLWMKIQGVAVFVDWGFISVKNWLAISCRVFGIFFPLKSSKTEPGNPTSPASDSHFPPSGPHTHQAN